MAVKSSFYFNIGGTMAEQYRDDSKGMDVAGREIDIIERINNYDDLKKAE